MVQMSIVNVCVSVPQTLLDDKTSHEKDMSNMRAHYEEETSQMKEGQARTLEEVAKKHRVTLENALSNAEKDKNRLLSVSPLYPGGTRGIGTQSPPPQRNLEPIEKKLNFLVFRS